jgi:hypothetical protein
MVLGESGRVGGGKAKAIHRRGHTRTREIKAEKKRKNRTEKN